MDGIVSDLSGSWKARGAAVLLLAAGIIHVMIVSSHWGHAPAHGIFMGAIGAAEIVWALAFWLRPSHRLAQAGIIIAVSCITLWGITRILPAPFEHGPEEIDAAGLVTKALESVTTVLLVGIVRSLPYPESDRRVRRAVAALILLAVLTGFGAYGAARASEPLFPGLVAAETQEHELEESGPGELEQQDSAIPEGMGLDHEHELLPTP
jgi:hypothetical protein